MCQLSLRLTAKLSMNVQMWFDCSVSSCFLLLLLRISATVRPFHGFTPVPQEYLLADARLSFLLIPFILTAEVSGWMAQLAAWRTGMWETRVCFQYCINRGAVLQPEALPFFPLSSSQQDCPPCDEGRGVPFEVMIGSEAEWESACWYSPRCKKT